MLAASGEQVAEQFAVARLRRGCFEACEEAELGEQERVCPAVLEVTLKAAVQDVGTRPRLADLDTGNYHGIGIRHSCPCEIRGDTHTFLQVAQGSPRRSDPSRLGALAKLRVTLPRGGTGC